MKKVVSVLIVIVLAALVVSAPAMAAIEVEGDVYAGVYDKYMWRGLNLSGSRDIRDCRDQSDQTEETV